MIVGSALVHSGNFHPAVARGGDGHDEQTPAQSEVVSGKRVSDLDGFGRGSKNGIRRKCSIGKAIRTATSAAEKHGNRNQCDCPTCKLDDQFRSLNKQRNGITKRIDVETKRLLLCECGELSWCPRRDSNSHDRSRGILSPLRLPIPPLGPLQPGIV